jgi:hypothetical protein
VTPTSSIAASDATPSPLVLCDHLLTLAQQAERAGYPGTAARLVGLAESMFRERPRRVPSPADRPRQSSKTAKNFRTGFTVSHTPVKPLGMTKLSPAT